MVAMISHHSRHVAIQTSTLMFAYFFCLFWSQLPAVSRLILLALQVHFELKPKPTKPKCVIETETKVEVGVES